MLLGAGLAPDDLAWHDQPITSLSALLLVHADPLAQSYDAGTVQINILLLILINFSSTVGKIVPMMLLSLYQS